MEPPLMANHLSSAAAGAKMSDADACTYRGNYTLDASSEMKE